MASRHDTRSEADYDLWMRIVDAIVQRRYGVRYDDLPDMESRAAYDAGSSAQAFVDDEVAELVAELGG
jgi:hypothetical protein